MKAEIRLAVFGVGLIGGSFSLALKKAGMIRETLGFGRSSETLDQAKNLGIIDRRGSDEDLAHCDLVLIATPVGQMPGIMERIARHLGEGTLVTDAGSTKGDVVGIAREALGENLSKFVPAHPIAGAEASGPAAARADLFEGKKVVLTPIPENAPETVETVKGIWEACGASVSEVSPGEHDGIFATVSHLPHLLSFALVHDIAQRENRDLLLSFAASGFRDFTRIAASSPEMWRDICLANRDALLTELGLYMQELEVLHEALAENDAVRLEEIFSLARAVRNNWTSS